MPHSIRIEHVAIGFAATAAAAFYGVVIAALITAAWHDAKDKRHDRKHPPK